jgi:hypothetical protein
MSSKPSPRLGGQKPVAGPALEGEIDARDLIKVVEDHQRRRVVDQGDPAGLQPAALLPAREQAEQLLLANELEFPAHASVLPPVNSPRFNTCIRDGIKSTDATLCPRLRCVLFMVVRNYVHLQPRF